MELWREELYANMAYEQAYLSHHGVKGMKWGIRRYHQWRSDRLSNRSKANANKAKTAKTKLGKHIRNVRAYNLKSMSGYHKKMSKASNKQLAKDYLLYNTTLHNTKVKSLAGRTTNYGKMYWDNYFTGGAIGAVKDVKYLADKHKAKKAKSK